MIGGHSTFATRFTYFLCPGKECGELSVKEETKVTKVRLEGLEARTPLPSTVSGIEYAVNIHLRLGRGEEGKRGVKEGRD